MEPFAPVKLVRNSKSPIAEAAVRHIAQLYAIEAMVRGSSPDIRLAARKEHSLPIVAALKSWFEKQLTMRPPRPVVTVARRAGHRDVRLHHRAERLDRCRKAESAEARPHFRKRFVHSPGRVKGNGPRSFLPRMDQRRAPS
ncbi:hypothetical protein A1D31_36575 [Bradyrhizobium liaoningense]|nr:hypothetical protein A1D31_36575 [Bradyrhizobium liaoningense]